MRAVQPLPFSATSPLFRTAKLAWHQTTGEELSYEKATEYGMDLLNASVSVAACKAKNALLALDKRCQELGIDQNLIEANSGVTDLKTRLYRRLIRGN